MKPAHTPAVLGSKEAAARALRKAERQAKMREQMEELEALAVREIEDALQGVEDESRRRKGDAMASLLLLSRLQAHLENDRPAYESTSDYSAQLIASAEKQAAELRQRFKLVG